MARAGEIEDARGRRIAVGLVQACSGRPRKSMRKRSLERRPILRPKKNAPFGIEREGHRGLADPAALRRLLQQQPVGLELPHDDRDGLRRQPGQPRDLGLGEAAVAADQREDQPLVVEPHAGLVGAAARIDRALPCGVGGRALRLEAFTFPPRLAIAR